MKKIIFILCFLTSLTYSQYEDTGKRGAHFSRRMYVESPIPVYETSRDKLPSPVIEDKPEWIQLYWKTWQLAFSHFKQPVKGSPFVSNYLDEAFAPNIFQWDTFFMIMFARYAHHVFPSIQSLDNFYSRQYENGYICREIVEATGEDFVFEGREHTVNPPLFSWAEIENFKITGDKTRFRLVLPALEKYAEWLELYRKKGNTKHNLYWQTGLGSGMDNTPRSGSGWLDMSSQMVMMYNDMSKMCDEVGYTDKSKLYKEKANEIGKRINSFMWNEEDGLFYDVDDNGIQIKCKTVACFWPMLAGVADVNQSQKLLANLKDPKSFWRKIPFPSLAADEKKYKADGEYWLGSVWAPTNVMIIKGLDKFGTGHNNAYNFNEFATLAAEEYLNGIYEVYRRTGTIWENYSAEAYVRGVWSRPDFVGWTGCGPIQLLIENILGFRPNGVDNSLTWYINRIVRHGIENLTFGDVTVSLVCDRRENINSEMNINVSSSKPFKLIVKNSNSLEQVFEIPAGNFNITVKL